MKRVGLVLVICILCTLAGCTSITYDKGGRADVTLTHIGMRGTEGTYRVVFENEYGDKDVFTAVLSPLNNHKVEASIPTGKYSVVSCDVIGEDAVTLEVHGFEALWEGTYDVDLSANVGAIVDDLMIITLVGVGVVVVFIITVAALAGSSKKRKERKTMEILLS